MEHCRSPRYLRLFAPLTGCHIPASLTILLCVRGTSVLYGSNNHNYRCISRSKGWLTCNHVHPFLWLKCNQNPTLPPYSVHCCSVCLCLLVGPSGHKHIVMPGICFRCRRASIDSHVCTLPSSHRDPRRLMGTPFLIPTTYPLW
jgi:hypothetical protein